MSFGRPGVKLMIALVKMSAEKSILSKKSIGLGDVQNSGSARLYISYGYRKDSSTVVPSRSDVMYATTRVWLRSVQERCVGCVV